METKLSLYKQEIHELTELLNTEWLDLNDLLTKEGFETKGGYLVCYYEDESGGQYGVFVTSVGEVFEFAILDGELKGFSTEEVELECYPQIEVALKYFVNKSS
ncbi:hypothetical protein [Klebsiella aerogenes]|uniref:hypothetical protein n=1 Tax=Klebsiella aerogenes TaxID=548 RepID=UPI002279962C|nr:hypothetical protein [Klebsiella aerogenes]MCY4764382.1 hypothetical protein [Klebsiella aerogenes]